MDKRRFSRTQFSAAASLLVDGATLECTVLNLSLKGTLLEVGTAGMVPLEAPVALSIQLQNEDTVITAQGICVHEDGHEIGIRFSSTDLDSLTHLRRLMELNTADPALIDRELGFLVDD